MDVNKLLNESGSLRNMVDAQHEIDSIKTSLEMGVGDELARIQSMLLRVSGGLPHSYTSIAEQEAAKLAMLGITGIGDLTAGGLETMEGLTRSNAEKALGFGALDLPKDPRDLGAVDWEEMDRAAKEREQLERMNQSIEFNQHFIREAAEARQREDAKIEYARRSAEASEGALEAERQRTADAREETRLANEETRIARRDARISHVLAGVALILAAWPFIREALG